MDDSMVTGDAGEQQRAAALLTAEHAALQTERSATVFEATGRVQTFLGALSSAVVASAFVGQATGLDRPFFAFAAAVLLPCLAIGVATLARAQQTAIDDVRSSRRIERIRRFYVEISPLAAEFLAPPADDGVEDAVRAMAGRPGRWQVALTTAGMVAIVNAAVAGAVVGLLSALVAPVAVAWVVGLAVAGAAAAGQLYWQQAAWDRSEDDDPLPRIGNGGSNRSG